MVCEKDLLERTDYIDSDGAPDAEHDAHVETLIGKMKPIYTSILDALTQEIPYPLGHLLDVASGPVSFASVYPDTVALDIERKYVRGLRRRGIKAVQGDMEKMEFDALSFDTSICLFPPRNNIIEMMRRPIFSMGHLPMVITWQQRLAQYMLPLARKLAVLHDPIKENEIVSEATPFEDYFLDFYNVQDILRLKATKAGSLYVLVK